MNNEEAIKHLKAMIDYDYNDDIDAVNLAIKALENKPDYDIVFLCDGKACGENHDCMECRHTLDIHHAKNFHYNPILSDKNYYWEVDDETQMD